MTAYFADLDDAALVSKIEEGAAFLGGLGGLAAHSLE
jgi:hypothetical protein